MRVFISLLFLSTFFLTSHLFPQNKDLYGTYTGKVIGSVKAKGYDRDLEINADAVLDVGETVTMSYTYSSSTTFQRIYKLVVNSNADLSGTLDNTKIILNGTDKSSSTISGPKINTNTTKSTSNLTATGDYSVDAETKTGKFTGTIVMTGGGTTVTLNFSVTGKTVTSSAISLIFNRGTVKVIKKGQTEAKIITGSETVDNGDVIITGENTRATLKYQDGAVFRIKSNTKITIRNDVFVLECGDDLGDRERGEIGVNVLKLGHEFQFQTPSSVCGCADEPAPHMGLEILTLLKDNDLTAEFTIIILKSGEEQYKVLNGAIEIKIKSSGEKLLLSSGEMVKINDNEFSKVKYFDTDKEKELEEKSFKSGSDEPVKTEEIEKSDLKKKKDSEKIEEFFGLNIKQLLVITGILFISVIIFLILIIAIYFTFRKKK